MDDYQKFIHASRYARWKEEEGRRETWPETVGRYVNFFYDKCGHLDPTRKVFNSIYDSILNLDVMGSMRAVMTAGPALEETQVAGYNPVTGDTLVVTKEYGNVAIKELEGETCSVLNKEGRWALAQFRCYGDQPIYKVVARLNSNTVKEITCTGEHRWVRQDGTVVPTVGLKEGDKVDFVTAPKPSIDSDYYLGIKHGLVYGDGTAVRAYGRVKGYHIRLCGEDNRELLRFFSEYPVAYPPSANGDPVVQMYDDFAHTHALKELPPDRETDSYLLGFIRGWMAADGSVSNTSQISLCTHTEGKAWLSRNSERIGFVIQREYKQKAETNYGRRGKDSWVIYFSRSSMTSDDFLCSWKKENFRPLVSRYVIKSVEELNKIDTVYCAEVEDTNTFVLAGGMVTGNCCFVAVDEPIVFDEIMYILMCFHPDTKVVTRAGNKRIADIQIGDEVASIDESTGKCVWKTVTDNIKTKSSNKPKVEVLLDNGQKFKCTSDHKWLTTNRGWVEAGDLTTEDDLVSPTWKIYRITNSLNNKSYIGQTSKSVKSRLAKHMYDSKNNIGNSHFRKAIRKYPSSVWSIDIIDFAFSQAEANEKEVYWISKCDTLSNGYNSTVGGEGSSGYMWTDEQRRRAAENAYERTDEHRERQRRVLAMSKEKIDLARSTEEYKEAQRIRNLGERNPHYGKKHSEEWKAKLRERNTGASNPFFGRKHSEETKYNISATKKAMKHKLEEVG